MTVTVTNVDEDGKVSFDGDGLQPQVGRALVAAFGQDGPRCVTDDEKWQWARGPADMETLDGHEKATLRPVRLWRLTIGYYLRRR